jgi:hypothetical protein
LGGAASGVAVITAGSGFETPVICPNAGTAANTNIADTIGSFIAAPSISISPRLYTTRI